MSAALGPGLDRALLRGFEVALRLRDADFVERYDRAWASDEPGAEQEGSRRERDEFSKGLADVWLVIAAFVAMPIERVLVLEVIEGLGSRRLRRLGRTEVGTIMLAAACGAVGFFVFR